jgi:hypothetical protein
MSCSAPHARVSVKARTLGTLAFLLPLMASHAHAGPVEQLVDVVFGPGDSNVMVARYDQGGGGLVLSADGGSTWKLLCDSLFLEPDASVKGAPVVLANGTLLVANSRGLSSGDLQGCNWHAEFSAANGTAVGALALDLRSRPCAGRTTHPVAASRSLATKAPRGQTCQARCWLQLAAARRALARQVSAQYRPAPPAQRKLEQPALQELQSAWSRPQPLAADAQ